MPLSFFGDRGRNRWDRSSPLWRHASRWIAATLLCSAGLCLFGQTPKGWTPGEGYGWVWGPEDEVGALNAITDAGSVLRALGDVKKGKVYDLGVRVDRTSYRWKGHPPTEIISYRSPAGVKLESGRAESLKRRGITPSRRFFASPISR